MNGWMDERASELDFPFPPTFQHSLSAGLPASAKDTLLLLQPLKPKAETSLGHPFYVTHQIDYHILLPCFWDILSKCLSPPLHI